MKCALTGQDGAYPAELRLAKGYEVHGIKRRSSQFNTDRIEHLYQADPHEQHGRFRLHYGDLSDATNLIRIVQEVQPNEIYNPGAMSHVKVSFDTPECTADVDAADFRPTETHLLIGEPTRARTALGGPPPYDLPALVSGMVQCDLKLFRRDTVLPEAGHEVLSYRDE